MVQHGQANTVDWLACSITTLTVHQIATQHVKQAMGIEGRIKYILKNSRIQLGFESRTFDSYSQTLLPLSHWTQVAASRVEEDGISIAPNSYSSYTSLLYVALNVALKVVRLNMLQSCRTWESCTLQFAQLWPTIIYPSDWS